MKVGDQVYSCDDDECHSVTIESIEPNGENCTVKNEEGFVFETKLSFLQVSCEDRTEASSNLTVNDRVIIRHKATDGSAHEWTGLVKKIHANERASVSLDELGGLVTVDLKKIVRL